MALARSHFKQHEILHGDHPNTDLVPILRAGEALQRGVIHPPLRIPRSIEEEEAGLAEFTVEYSSGGFERTREKVRDALRAIAGFTMKRFGIPKQVGCDVGSGASGYMVETLLAPYINKGEWLQMELNPAAVAANKARHPHSMIMEGSYHKMHDALHGQFDVATGLSSLDATQFVANAVAEMRKILKDGGFFMHIQDVRPGMGAPIREMLHRGHQLPLYMEQLHGGTSPFINYLEPRLAEMGFPAGNIPSWSVGELFRSELGRIVQEDPELELLSNEWVTARRRIDSLPGRHYWMNILVNSPQAIEEASAVVTVARKRAS